MKICAWFILNKISFESGFAAPAFRPEPGDPSRPASLCIPSSFIFSYWTKVSIAQHSLTSRTSHNKY